VATGELLEQYLFGDDQVAGAVIAYEGEVPVGFALYFFSFSTFLARPGISLEDLFVLEEKRGKGYGKALLKYLASMAVEKECGRLEWAVLDWNKPSIDFYDSLGARPMNEWITYRLEGDSLDSFTDE
jgi:GNAT superfamily N-acetyltransferase